MAKPLVLNRTQAADYIGVNRRTIENWEKKQFLLPDERTPDGRPIYYRASLDRRFGVTSEETNTA